MVLYNHVKEHHAACLPALLIRSVQPCCLKTCDRYLFTITTQTCPLSFCVNGQTRALFNSRKDDTLQACSFEFCVDRLLRSMLCYAATANQSVSKLESNFIFKYDFSRMCPWDCRRRRCSHLVQR